MQKAKAAPVVREFIRTVRSNRKKHLLIDKDKIPESTLNELIDLIGFIEADAFLEANQYNYQAVQNKILQERIKRSNVSSWFVRIYSRIKIWVARNRKLIVLVCLLAIALVTIYKILD